MTFCGRLASKILKITQEHTKEAAAKTWRRNNLEAMDMPMEDDDASDGGEVGKEEEFAQRLKRKAKEEQVGVMCQVEGIGCRVTDFAGAVSAAAGTQAGA